MSMRRVGAVICLLALAPWPLCMRASAARLPGTPGAAWAQSTTQTNPPPKPKKKPEEPIDPDTTAGVRGSGAKHTVRVLIKGKPAEGAHVVMKNTNGNVAATCDTNESGECQVQLGPDRYAVAATGNGRTGAVTLDVSDASGPIVIKLKKAKTESGAPRP